jgi:phospholipid N-methyltransferase
MDVDWLPNSLRCTLRDILEVVCSEPFRFYYTWILRRIEGEVSAERPDRIVELGAGNAPVTRRLAKAFSGRPVAPKLRPTDINPDLHLYNQLHDEHKDLVEVEERSIDYSKELPIDGKAIVVLSATLHHIPLQGRVGVVKNLAESGHKIMIFENMHRSLLSLFYALLAFVPALLVPLLLIGRPQSWRRFLWCWVLPVAPFLLVWDGLVTCVRNWTARDWHKVMKAIGVSKDEYSLTETLFCQCIIINKKK